VARQRVAEFLAAYGNISTGVLRKSVFIAAS
jgi:hypothetical protein